MSFEALKTLPNGLRVWRSQVDTGLVLLQLNVMVGFQNEVENNLLEFCHCNEHMAAKWTSAAHPSSEQNTLLLSEQSIETNAFTTVDMTGYYMKGLSDAVELMVDVFTASFTDPQYDASVFDAEMAAVQNELQNIAAGTWYGHDIAQRRVLYPGTPLVADEDLKIQNVQRLRQSKNGMGELMDWRRRNYNPALCTLFVCGPVSDEVYRGMLERLGAMAVPGSLPRIAATVPRPLKALAVSAPMEGRQMHRVSFTFDATDTKSDAPVTSFTFHQRAMMDLISSVLSGAGLGARLYRRLRTAEKLIYAVSSGSSLDGCGRLRGKFIIDTKFQTVGGNGREQLQKVVKAVMDELGSLVGKGITDAEMRQWVQAVKMNEIVANGIRDSRTIAATSFFDYVRFVIPQLTYVSDDNGVLKTYLGCRAPAKVVDHSAYVRMLHKIKKSEVNAFARRLFRSEVFIVHTVP